MTKADLEKQHETGLISVLSNDCMPEELKVYAAVLLYKRGSLTTIRSSVSTTNE